MFGRCTKAMASNTFFYPIGDVKKKPGANNKSKEMSITPPGTEFTTFSCLSANTSMYIYCADLCLCCISQQQQQQPTSQTELP